MNIGYRDKIKGVVYSGLSALLLTGVFLFSNLAQQTIRGPVFLFWWFLLALPFLPIFWLQIGTGLLPLFRRHWRFFLVYNLIEAGGNILFFYLLRMIHPSIVSFLHSLTPVFIAIIAYFFLRERLSRQEWLGGAISMAGVLVITWASPDVGIPLVALTLFMTIIFAFNNVLVKRWITDVPPAAVSVFRIILQAVFFVAYLAAAGTFRWPSEREWIFLVLGSLSGPVFGMYVVFLALKHLKSTQVFIIRNLQPFFVTVAAYLFLRQYLSARQLIGGLLIICGVSLMLAVRWWMLRKASGRKERSLD